MKGVKTFLMSTEAWKAFFDWGTVVLIGFTFVFGAGALITGKILSDRQDEQLRQFDKDMTDAKVGLATQQERAANAERAAGEASQRAAEANERAASLELESLELRERLSIQGARENLVTGENRRHLVETLKTFAGQKVDVRRSALPFMVNDKIVSVTPIGDDTIGLAEALLGVVKDAGWLSPPTVLPWGIQETGISVEITDVASPSTRAAAEALVKALRSISLVASGPKILPLKSDRFARVGTIEQATPPVLEKDTILLGILVHPK